MSNDAIGVTAALLVIAMFTAPQPEAEPPRRENAVNLWHAIYQDLQKLAKK